MEEEINLVDVYRILKSNFKKIISIVFGLTFLVFFVCHFVPKTYRSTVTLLPIGGGQNSAMASLSAQLGGVPLIGGMLGGAAGPTPTGMITAFLKSQTVSETLINRYDLLKVFFKKNWDPVSQKWKVENSKDIPTLTSGVGYYLKYVLTIEPDAETGVLNVSIDLGDPKLSMEVANGLIEELGKFINSNAFSDAKKSRFFIEEQLVNNEKELLLSSKALSDYYQSHNISSSSSTLNVDLSRLGLLNNEQEEPLKEVEKLQQAADQLKEKIDPNIVHNIPQQAYLEYLAMRKEVLARVNGILSSQYEMAKIQESKESIQFQVIDSARESTGVYSPKTLLITAVTFVGSWFVALFYVFVAHSISALKIELKKQETHS